MSENGNVQYMKDRLEILDCLVRYCRGIDRLDRELARSAYHTDGLDDHGDYVGGIEGFLDFYFAYHSHYQHRTMHTIGNHSCELDGDTAHCETYWTYSTLDKQKPFYGGATGRYIDRLERRDGEWKIAVRICVINGVNNHHDPEGVGRDLEFLPPARDKSDPSYMRPLKTDPARINTKVFVPA